MDIPTASADVPFPADAYVTQPVWECYVSYDNWRIPLEPMSNWVLVSAGTTLGKNMTLPACWEAVPGNLISHVQQWNPSATIKVLSQGQDGAECLPTSTPIQPDTWYVCMAGYSIFMDAQYSYGGVNHYRLRGGAITFARASQNYIVRLSPASSAAESETVLKSVEPTDNLSNASGKNATYLLAQVYDQNNQLVPNVGVQLNVDVVNQSGGHKHGAENDDRHVNYSGKLSPGGGANGTVSDNGRTLTGNTDANGLTFTFTAPEPAGDHTFTALCIDGKTCTLQGPNQVWVGVKDGNKDLTSLPASSLWEPVGDTTIHPDNYYLTERALNALTRLAQLYHDTFPNNPALRLNDASLKRGGVFDIEIKPYADDNGVYHSRTPGGVPGQWWVAPHEEHRRGVVIDIRANKLPDAIPLKDRRKFEQLIKGLPPMQFLHESINTDNEHYHVRLLGLSL